MSTSTFTARATLTLVGLCAPLLSGCRQDMHDQPRYEPLEKSAFFADGRSSRPQVPGTVARGELRLDEHLFEGTVGGEQAATFPFEVTADVLERGQDRYNVFCSVCHDRLGTGQGMIVKRGMKQPTSFHVERLREAPHGYFFDVITNGFGVMYDYSDRITPEDRWAIVAYVRALQLSQNANVGELAEDDRQRLEGLQ